MLVVLTFLLLLVDGSWGCSSGIIVGDITTNFPGSTYIALSGGTQVGGVSIAGNSVTIEHNRRVYIAGSCDNQFTPTTFYPLKLLGRTLSFTTDLSGVGCACNAAVYLVNMPAYDSNSIPDPTKCGDYYCDANKVCGIYCVEMDIMEANNVNAQTTPHKCNPPQGNYYPSCDGGGCGINLYKTNTQYYGYGSNFLINTQLPFGINVTFATAGGVLSAIHTTYFQSSRAFTITHDSSRCGDYVGSMTEAFQKGMVVVMSYWGDTGATMSWLDVPPCSINTACNAGNPVTFSNFQVY